MEHLWIGLSVIFIFLVDNYLFKVNYENTRTMLEICSKLTIKIPERRYWRCSGFIVKFEQISHIVLVFPLLRWTGKHKQNYFCWFQQKHFKKNSLSRKALLTTSGRLNSRLVSIDLSPCWGNDYQEKGILCTLREKCPYSEFFWSVFSYIRTEYGPGKLRIRTISTPW